MRNLSVISIFALLVLVGITGCSVPRETIYTAPLCDCRYSNNEKDGCLGASVCSASTPCAHTNGLNDKCVPAESD